MKIKTQGQKINGMILFLRSFLCMYCLIFFYWYQFVLIRFVFCVQSLKQISNANLVDGDNDDNDDNRRKRRRTTDTESSNDANVGQSNISMLPHVSVTSAGWPKERNHVSKFFLFLIIECFLFQ